MELETLLNLIACPTIVVWVFVHRFVVEPKLKRHRYETGPIDDWQAFRDWQVYSNQCGGSAPLYWLLWIGNIVAHLAILLLIVQFFLFPDVRLWE